MDRCRRLLVEAETLLVIQLCLQVKLALQVQELNLLHQQTVRAQAGELLVQGHSSMLAHEVGQCWIARPTRSTSLL